MFGIEQVVIHVLIQLFPREAINEFLRDPQNTAVLIGALIAISGSLLGTFLLLRGMSLTSDAISHTVLLGIVTSLLVMTALLGLEPDLSSPWLIIGAAGAGVATVVLTELIHRSGLVRQDAALGLAFPLLFALAIILVSRFADHVHIDQDSVMVGEIGVAWANTNSHCIENCDTVTIREDDPRALITRQCINCLELGISPRDTEAQFQAICINCGTYTPAQAYREGLIEQEPVLVFWPKSVTVTALLALLAIGFVGAFYKELKLATFDAALARTLGFRPGALTYALMVLVSLVAVGAFDAVGSILVVAFFIIPPAAAYLLTDRLAVMLLISPVIGALGAFFGYDLARGYFLSVVPMADLIRLINGMFGLHMGERWNSSISASMVLMMFFFFLLAWVLSPKYGLVSTALRRAQQRREFDRQVVLGHIHHHHRSAAQAHELALATLHEHFRWTPAKMARVLRDMERSHLIDIDGGAVTLTVSGEAQMRAFRQRHLGARAATFADEPSAV